MGEGEGGECAGDTGARHFPLIPPGEDGKEGEEEEEVLHCGSGDAVTRCDAEKKKTTRAGRG